jgi:hypothetical protein
MPPERAAPTIERTDLRFMLSQCPRTVALLGDLRAAADAFALVGLDVVDGDEPADLVLAPAALGPEAIARARTAVALEGRGGARTLAATGLPSRRLLALPDTTRPALVLPLDRRKPLRYATRHFAGRATRMKMVRNRLAPLVLARGLVPAEGALAVAERNGGPPFLIAAARDAGVPADGDFLWATGSSDVLSRGALFVFARGEAAPEWVIKFGRVPDARAAFDRDAAGLSLAARARGAAAARAPRLLARLDAGGLPAAVETAAGGERLSAFLMSAAKRTAKRAVIDRVAAWIVEYARETASGPPAIAPEIARLRRDVVPAWRDVGARDDLLDGLERAPAVLQHNDLGTWNVLVAGDGFTAVDWESARAAGLPLWDLLYFLAYAIVAVDDVPREAHEAHLVNVFLGRSPSSALVFRWVRQAVAMLALEPDSVGRLAVTGWLHHGLSHVARDRAVSAAGGQSADEATALPRRLARRWLLEPGLGPGWSRWRGE